MLLQQCLPFTVLKPAIIGAGFGRSFNVATVLTVYGIETVEIFVLTFRSYKLQQCLPFTVLKLPN